jgi:hypothetical protein
MRCTAAEPISHTLSFSFRPATSRTKGLSGDGRQHDSVVETLVVGNGHQHRAARHKAVLQPAMSDTEDAEERVCFMWEQVGSKTDAEEKKKRETQIESKGHRQEGLRTGTECSMADTRTMSYEFTPSRFSASGCMVHSDGLAA